MCISAEVHRSARMMWRRSVPSWTGPPLIGRGCFLGPMVPAGCLFRSWVLVTLWKLLRRVGALISPQHIKAVLPGWFHFSQNAPVLSPKCTSACTHFSASCHFLFAPAANTEGAHTHFVKVCVSLKGDAAVREMEETLRYQEEEELLVISAGIQQNEWKLSELK